MIGDKSGVQGVNNIEFDGPGFDHCKCKTI